MRNTHDPIPVDAIFIRDAFDGVFRTLIPDWKILEERLHASSPHYHGLQEQDAKRAYEEAWRSYDQARLRANSWLRERMSQGILVAQVLDPKSGERRQLDSQLWDTMGDLDTMLVFNDGIVVVDGVRRRAFFDRKEFDNVVMEIAPPDGCSAAHPGRNVPAASKAMPTLPQQILIVYRQLWPSGCNEVPAQRNKLIRGQFKDLGRPEPSDRSIQRAVQSLKSD